MRSNKRSEEMKRHDEMHFLLDLIITDHSEGHQSFSEKFLSLTILMTILNLYIKRKISVNKSLEMTYEFIKRNFK